MLSVKAVSGKDNTADIGTKHLARKELDAIKERLHLSRGNCADQMIKENQDKEDEFDLEYHYQAHNLDDYLEENDEELTTLDA